MRYLELKLKLEPRGDRFYEVEAVGPSGECDGTFTVPFDPIQLENYILKFGRTRRGVRRVESTEMELARTFGTQLFDALFSSSVRDLYRDSWRQAASENNGLRIKLSLTRTPELMDLPWEYLCDERSFLSISPYTPIVRYLDLPRARPALAVEPPIRVLGMISAPEDAIALDVGREQEKLETVLRSRLGGSVEVEWLADATLQNLLERLDEREYHIFHFIGHGGYDHGAQESVLLFEDVAGRGSTVDGSRLGTILADHPTLRLAVLNACEGARTARNDPFSGVASALVQAGIPAVVAMQFEISDRAAIVFAEKLYSALARSRPIDWALAHARKAIYADHNDIEWATPVLFMRTPDGQIFDVAHDEGLGVPPTPTAQAPALSSEVATEAEITQRAPADTAGGAALTSTLAKRYRVRTGLRWFVARVTYVALIFAGIGLLLLLGTRGTGAYTTLGSSPLNRLGTLTIGAGIVVAFALAAIRPVFSWAAAFVAALAFQEAFGAVATVFVEASRDGEFIPNRHRYLIAAAIALTLSAVAAVAAASLRDNGDRRPHPSSMAAPAPLVLGSIGAVTALAALFVSPLTANAAGSLEPLFYENPWYRLEPIGIVAAAVFGVILVYRGSSIAAGWLAGTGVNVLLYSAGVAAFASSTFGEYGNEIRPSGLALFGTAALLVAAAALVKD
jgi:hypothetical protein